MGVFANFIPTLKITRELSFKSNVRHYTSLVQVLQCHPYSNSSLSRNFTLQRFYSINKLDEPRNRFIKAFDKEKLKDSSIKKCKSIESTSSVLPIAFINLNPLSVNSTKVLLIPLNWQNADENLIRKTITSLFSKPKNLQQIEAFSEALEEVSTTRTEKHKNMPNKEKRSSIKGCLETVKHEEELKLDKSQKSKDISGNVEDKQKIVQSSEAAYDLQNFQKNKKQEYSFENPQNSKEELTEIAVPAQYSFSNSKNDSLMPLNGNNIGHLDCLAAAVDKALQQCCLQSIQMSVDVNLLGEIIEGLKFYPTLTKMEYGKSKEFLSLALNNTSFYNSLSMASIMKIDASSLNLDEIEWHYKNPFAEIQSSSLTNITFPANVIRKSFSTRSIDSSMWPIPPKRSSHSDNSNNKSSKPKANYNLQFLSNLFGAEELLMSCDAYNKALKEAVKRREVLARQTNQLKETKEDGAANRHHEMSVKGCSEPTYRRDSEVNALKSSNSCPPPVKQATKEGRKKDDPCKKSQCPNPFKDEMEKLKHKKDENAKRKTNKMFTGCVSSKCENDNSCSELKKNPCKKPSYHKSAAQVNSTMKQARDGCKKDDSGRPAECPNPCKDEMEKLRREIDEYAKNKKDEIPSGCISPKCRKDDGCGNLKRSPCKKDSEKIGSSSSAKKSSTFSMEFTKAKDKNNPCTDENKEYKPKCNKDPCKNNNETCGDSSSKPTKPKSEDCKKNVSKEGGQKEKEPCKKKSSHSNESKMEDHCRRVSKKEDPCKKKEKKDPSEGNKKNENPSKKKETENQYGKDKQKEDPCKKKEKKDPCGEIKQKKDSCNKNEKNYQKEDSCKEKKDPCGGCSKKEDSCKEKNSNSSDGNKKEDKSSPCASNKKEDPCKQKNQSDPCSSKQKEEPCMKKNSSSCTSQNKNVDSSKTEKKPNRPCRNKVSSSPCKKSKKKYKPKCKKSPSSSSLGSKKSDSKIPCGKPKKETKPNCSNNKKRFSTLALNAAKTSNFKIKRTFTSRTALPILRNKGMNSFHFMHHFSSKSGKNNNNKDIDHGKESKCKSMAAVIPPKRKSAYNPHPKDGLRICYPTYDMDCKKLCKEPRQTACNRYSFLKDTDNHERKGKPNVFKISQIDKIS